jgi:exodeoxyribonuclease-3
VALGFVDVFRKLHPDAVQYTYWDYYRNAFQRNFGWRIDHILATSVLAERCHAAEVDMGPRGVPGASDHTIVWAEFNHASARGGESTEMRDNVQI